MVFSSFQRSATGAGKQEQPATDVGTRLPQTWEARLDRVEKEQSRLRFTLLRVILLGGAIVGLSQVLLLSLFSRSGEGPMDPEPEKKSEGRFQSLYTEQLWLRPKPGTPSLVQVDSNGVGRIVLRAEKDGRPSLQLGNQRGWLRLGIPSAENDGPQIVLLDGMQRTRARLTLTSEGHPSLTLCDEEERARAVLTVEDRQPRLVPLDEKQSTIPVRPQR